MRLKAILRAQKSPLVLASGQIVKLVFSLGNVAQRVCLLVPIFSHTPIEKRRGLLPYAVLSMVRQIR